MEPWIYIGILAALLTAFGFVPQIVKMYRTGSAGNVSLMTLLQFSAGVGLWAFYGQAIGDPIVTAANIITFVTLVIAIALYLYYTRHETGVSS